MLYCIIILFSTEELYKLIIDIILLLIKCIKQKNNIFHCIYLFMWWCCLNFIYLCIHLYLLRTGLKMGAIYLSWVPAGRWILSIYPSIYLSIYIVVWTYWVPAGRWILSIYPSIYLSIYIVVWTCWVPAGRWILSKYLSIYLYIL